MGVHIAGDIVVAVAAAAVFGPDMTLHLLEVQIADENAVAVGNGVCYQRYFACVGLASWVEIVAAVAVVGVQH